MEKKDENEKKGAKKGKKTPSDANKVKVGLNFVFIQEPMNICRMSFVKGFIMLAGGS